MKDKDIKNAFESITPDDDAKERMFNSIIKKSQAALNDESVKPPESWYVRFKAYISVCGAAVVCAAIFAITIISPGIKDSSLIDKEHFIEYAPSTDNIETTLLVTETNINKSLNSETYTAVSAEKALNYNLKTSDSTITVQNTFSETVSNPPDFTTYTKHTSETTKTAVTQKTTPHITTSDNSATHTATAATTVTSNQVLYNELLNFNRLTWNGMDYTTDHTERFFIIAELSR